jgi:hypothetical protein
MRLEEKKWARKSLLISLAVHGAAFIFLAMYVIGVSTKVQELVSAMFVPESKPQKYEPRPQPVRPITRPSPPRSQVVDTDIVPVTTAKRLSPTPGRVAETNVLLRGPDDPLAQNVASPSSLVKDRVVPRAMTTARVLPADVSLPAAVSSGTSGQGGSGDRLGGASGMGAGAGGRSRAGSVVIRAAPNRQPLSMTRPHAAFDASEGLAEVAKGVTLGRSRVPPLPKGEPGGIVVGRGKDIEGYIRFARIKHFLADWWADPTAMPAVVYWMNLETKVHADMNIEGGAITLDDPKLTRCPLAIMTGHDRTLLIGNNLQGNYRHNLTDQEREGLRRYLIEAGGFLFFDECGHDLMLARLMKSELRAVLPEHSVEWIPNDHELYTCYYELGGPPPGAYKFWKHGGGAWQRVSKRYLEGLFINDRLAAVISNRDYLCAARTKNRPGHGYTGEESPSTYRFLTNVIIYALTHGTISEHSDYVPEMTDADRISIDAPVQVPVLLPK